MGDTISHKTTIKHWHTDRGETIFEARCEEPCVWWTRKTSYDEILAEAVKHEATYIAYDITQWAKS